MQGLGVRCSLTRPVLVLLCLPRVCPAVAVLTSLPLVPLVHAAGWETFLAYEDPRQDILILGGWRGRDHSGGGRFPGFPGWGSGSQAGHLDQVAALAQVTW